MPTAKIVPFQSTGGLQEALRGNLAATTTLEGLQGGADSLPAFGSAPSVPLFPVSGFRTGVHTIGRGLGWATWPLWRPMVEICSDTKRIPNVWRIPGQHLQGWKAKARADMALWDSWTPEQQASVDRQRGVWTLGLLISALFFLVLPDTGFIPLTFLSLAWWARSHDWHWPTWANQINPNWHKGSPVPHWDVVRWLLGLPQPGGSRE